MLDNNQIFFGAFNIVEVKQVLMRFLGIKYYKYLKGKIFERFL